jgi:hypothetical protein
MPKSTILKDLIDVMHVLLVFVPMDIYKNTKEALAISIKSISMQLLENQVPVILDLFTVETAKLGSEFMGIWLNICDQKVTS